MTKTSTFQALCSALPIASDGVVPEWVHVLPAGIARTVDGRGPYRVVSPQSICAASLAGGKKLPLDEAHATDKGALLGLAHPARGWIVELQSRDDGIWGRVDWNQSGRALMEDRAYSGVSPVIVHDKAGNVLQVLRASLTNTPNLTGLTALQSEEIGMDWRAKLLALLGLDSSADDATLEAALTAKMSGGQKELCSEDVARHPLFTALQSQVGELATALNTLQTSGRQTAAELFVDGAIKAGRVGVAPARAEYIAMHSANPTATEALIGKLPIVQGSLTIPNAQQELGNGGGALNRDDQTVMALFGVDEETYKAELAKGGQKKEIL